MWLPIFSILIGLTSGNFLYQAMTSADWDKAIDRSFFQFVAVMVAGLAVSWRTAP